MISRKMMGSGIQKLTFAMCNIDTYIDKYRYRARERERYLKL